MCLSALIRENIYYVMNLMPRDRQFKFNAQITNNTRKIESVESVQSFRWFEINLFEIFFTITKSFKQIKIQQRHSKSFFYIQNQFCFVSDHRNYVYVMKNVIIIIYTLIYASMKVTAFIYCSSKMTKCIKTLNREDVFMNAITTPLYHITLYKVSFL